MEKDHLWYRTRGLEKMESRFGEKPIQKFITRRTGMEEVVRVLELGFGEGRCLLELRATFPDKKVEFYGINDVKKGNMKKRSDFLENAKKFGIDIPKKVLPEPSFYDAGEGLHFDDDQFDVIISQVAFHYVGNKARLLEEIWRVLKPEGKAFLHVDASPNEEYPDFMKWNTQTPRFIIYEGGRMVKLGTYLRRIKESGHDITFRKAHNNPEQGIILMTKNTSKKLDLGLEYDGNSTLFLTKMKGTDEYKTDAGVWWGTRSVFNVK